MIQPAKVKVKYMRAVSKLHPDKLSRGTGVKEEMIAAAVFSALNNAWEAFKVENGINWHFHINLFADQKMTVGTRQIVGEISTEGRSSAFHFPRSNQFAREGLDGTKATPESNTSCGQHEPNRREIALKRFMIVSPPVWYQTRLTLSSLPSSQTLTKNTGKNQNRMIGNWSTRFARLSTLAWVSYIAARVHIRMEDSLTLTNNSSIKQCQAQIQIQSKPPQSSPYFL